jgi:hypothetical protein
MFTRPEGLDQFINVRPTLLDDASWVTPFIETWTQTRLPSALTGAKYSYEGFPPMEDYGKLVEEYATLGSRPGR